MKSLKKSPKCPNCGCPDYSISFDHELYVEVYECVECQEVWEKDWEPDNDSETQELGEKMNGSNWLVENDFIL